MLQVRVEQLQAQVLTSLSRSLSRTRHPYATHSPTPPLPAARTYRQVDDLTATMERQNAAKDGQLSALREQMEATSWAHSTKRAEVEARAATADEVARLRGEVQRLEDERAGVEAAAAAEKTRLMLKMEDELRAMHAKEHSDEDAATKRALEAQLGQARLSQKVDATLAELRHVTTAKARMEAVLESRLRDYEEASRRAALQVGVVSKAPRLSASFAHATTVCPCTPFLVPSGGGGHEATRAGGAVPGNTPPPAPPPFLPLPAPSHPFPTHHRDPNVRTSSRSRRRSSSKRGQRTNASTRR